MKIGNWKIYTHTDKNKIYNYGFCFTPGIVFNIFLGATVISFQHICVGEIEFTENKDYAKEHRG